MRAITEERAGTDMVFRVSVPANKADAVRRHLESMMMLLGESVVTIGAPEEPEFATKLAAVFGVSARFFLV